MNIYRQITDSTAGPT